MSDERTERLGALHRAAESLSSPSTSLGRRARKALGETTGLSPAGIEYALSECLEVSAGRAALTQLTRRAPPAPRAHVLLSANVFVAAYRAIALALAQTPRVFVRASTREPSMAELLWEGSSGAFELVDTLSPLPGDHFWAYGTTETLDTVRGTLPSGVHFHGHGPGLGVAVVRQPRELAPGELEAAIDGLSQDVIAFDQRGCLSPRAVLLEAPLEFAEDFCARVAASLSEWERAVPRGTLSSSERADVRRYEDTVTYAGGVRRAGLGLVTLDPVPERVMIPPVGRYLHMTRTEDALSLMKPFAAKITSVGFFAAPLLPGQCQQQLGAKRYVQLGQMQRPPLDGPVDLRVGYTAELI